MKFNASKCQIMRTHGSTKPLERLYTLNKQVLTQMDKAKYLGVMITHNLDLNSYINIIVTKANRCTGFYKRNISNCPQELRELPTYP